MGSKELNEEVTTVEEVVTPAEGEIVVEEPVEEVIEEVIEEPAEQVESIEGKPVAEVVEEWKPDFKFKVRDNEHEFDEEIKGLVTKENQGKLKELYEKAYGLDYTKKRLDQYDEQFNEMNPKIQKLEQQDQMINQLDSMLAKDDFSSFQKTLNITDDTILRRAAQILKVKEMPEAEKVQHEQNEATRVNQYNLEQQNQVYQNQFLDQARQAKNVQVDNLIASQNISSIATNFDTQAGQPGAFKQRVFQFAQNTYAQQGKDLTPEEAVNGFIAFAGIVAPVAPVAPVAAVGAVAQPGVVTKEKPTLPNIKSSNKAPARKVVRSIEDIKKLAEQMRD